MKITLTLDNGHDSVVSHSVSCNNDVPGAVAATQLAMDTAVTVALQMGWVAQPQQPNGSEVTEAEVVETDEFAV